MEVTEKTSFVYVLRCPHSNEIRYVGATRKPQARKTHHRSCKKSNPLLVDKWASDLAADGTPVIFEIVACVNDVGGVTSTAGAVEESIIAICRRAGMALLNMDVPAIKRRKHRVS